MSDKKKDFLIALTVTVTLFTTVVVALIASVSIAIYKQYERLQKRRHAKRFETTFTRRHDVKDYRDDDDDEYDYDLDDYEDEEENFDIGDEDMPF